jgi:hypothetical protein
VQTAALGGLTLLLLVVIALRMTAMV